MKKILVLLFILTGTLKAQQLQWAFDLGDYWYTDAYGVARDNQDNVLVTGAAGTYVCDFDPGPGTYTLTNQGVYDIFVAKYDKNEALQWAFRLGGGEVSWCSGNAITCDASGNVIITGYFQDTTDFDPGPGVHYLYPKSNYNDIFIAKYDPAGNFLWALNMGGNGTQTFFDTNVGNAVATDAVGNVLVTGFFCGTADFDPGNGTANLTAPSGVPNAFVAKYTPAGVYSWAFQFGGTYNVDKGNSICADAGGDVIVSGNFGGTADFDPGSGSHNLTSFGCGSDIFIARYSPTGSFIWANHFGGTTCEGNKSLAHTLDASGNIIVTGTYGGTVDFDPGASTHSLTSGSNDVFLAKYSSSGAYQWAFGTGGSGSGTDVETDSNGNIFFTGIFSGSADFNPGPATDTLPRNDGGFMAEYDANGNFIFVFSVQHPNGSYVAIDGNNDFYLAGTYLGLADFDPSAATYTLNPIGDEDVFVAKYSPTLINIHEQSIKQQISVFPNPASSQITVAGFKYTAENYSIENAFGQVVLESTSNKINIEYLPGGVYFVTAKTNNLIYKQKLIITR